MPNRNALTYNRCSIPTRCRSFAASALAAIPIHPVPQVRLQFAVRPDSLCKTSPTTLSHGGVLASVRTQDKLSALAVAGLADEHLVSRCRAGDQAAFTEIVRRYKDRVHWLVLRMVGGPDDEDITQEVFLRAYQAIPGLRAGATLRTWLFRIAHNLCVTELHKRGRRGEQVSLDDEGEEKLHHLLPQAATGFEEGIERQEFSDAVHRLVAKLPAHYREVLTLYYVEEVKYEEIAEIMGLPLGTVKTHLHRAKLKLRDLVMDEMDPAYLDRGKHTEGGDPLNGRGPQPGSALEDRSGGDSIP